MNDVTRILSAIEQGDKTVRLRRVAPDDDRKKLADRMLATSGHHDLAVEAYGPGQRNG